MISNLSSYIFQLIKIVIITPFTDQNSCFTQMTFRLDFTTYLSVINRNQNRRPRITIVDPRYVK